MKKNTLRSFTLVEMLIVIVIIGILIAALMPRMSAAQGRARDVARKTDLSQIQTAAISYYGDHGQFPAAASPSNADWVAVDTAFDAALKEMGMTSIPTDPQEGSTITAISNEGGKYRARVVSRNGVQDAGLLLVAHVEVLGSANAVSCGGEGDEFMEITDSKDFKPCKYIFDNSLLNGCVYYPDGACEYSSDKELIYVAAY